MSSDPKSQAEAEGSSAQDQQQPGGDPVDVESVADLERKLEEIERDKQATREEIARTRTEIRDRAFEKPLQRALDERGCLRTDLVVKHLKAEGLVRPGASGELTGILDGKEVDLSVIAELSRSDLIPELFRGARSGESAGAGAKILSPMEQLRAELGAVKA